MDLSIIIVNYNTPKLTKNTINSVIQTLSNESNIQYEIILVDNNSKPEVIEKLESLYLNSKSHSMITLIKNKKNYGFSVANNIGIKKSIGEYVLLLNSDTIVQENCLQKCINYIKENNSIGALGCKLVLADGSLDHACKRGFPSPKASIYYFLRLHKIFPNSKEFGRYTLNYLNDNTTNEVDSLTGAFMLLPKKIINEVGLLDENFFMYGEDIDWCFRIKEAGYKVVYYSEALTVHLKGQSSKKKRLKTIYEFHRAMILFYNKHYRSNYPLVVTFIMYFAVYTKMILNYLLNFFKKPKK